MAKLKEIFPIVPVADVIKSATFFEDVLGFKAQIKKHDIAIVCRDGIRFRLIRAGDNVGEQACYITVKGIDDLYNELEHQLSKLPEGRVRPPFNQEYGMREFHVIDLDNLLIFFGEDINQ